jgi:hypothetical protein
MKATIFDVRKRTLLLVSTSGTDHYVNRQESRRNGKPAAYFRELCCSTRSWTQCVESIAAAWNSADWVRCVRYAGWRWSEGSRDALDPRSAQQQRTRTPYHQQRRRFLYQSISQIQLASRLPGVYEYLLPSFLYIQLVTERPVSTSCYFEQKWLSILYNESGHDLGVDRCILLTLSCREFRS